MEENLLEMLEIHELRLGMPLLSPFSFSELLRESSPGRLDCAFPGLVEGGVGGAGSAVTGSRVASEREGGVTAPGKCECACEWACLLP